MTTPNDVLAGRLLDAIDKHDEANIHGWGVALRGALARSTPIPASNASEGLREARTALNVALGRLNWLEGREKDAERVVVHRRLSEDIETALAALAHAAPEGLDVERLARALCASRPPEPSPDYEMFVDDECRALAKRIAAAYAQPDATEEALR